MSVEQLSAQLPSDPKARQAIMDAIKEIDVALVKIDAQKTQIKVIKDIIKDEYDIPPALIGKLATVYHKQNFTTVTGKNEEFEEFYTILFEGESE